MSEKDKPKWDGRSRPTNDLYKKNYNKIFKEEYTPEELKEEHKNDEYIESYRNDDEWDFLDWLKFMWDSAPTDRRKYLRKNPDYIGPKKED